LIQAASRSNVRKYNNPNPVHQLLLRRFLRCVAQEAQGALRTHNCPRLLDVGCGEGYVLRHLRGAWPELAAQGVDGDREALVQARGSIPGAFLGHADASYLPFAGNSFDMVACLEVLEHLREPALAMEELARVSRGYLLLSVPNQPFFSLSNLVRGKNVRRLGEDPEHLHHWTALQFVSMIKGRFKVSRVRYPFPWVLVLAETR